MADISKVQLPNGTSYDIKDKTSGYITGMTILSYGSSTWQDFIDAYNANRVVYCRASSNSNPASGSQTRLAFMAYVNNATTPTNVEFQYYRSIATHSDSQQGDQVFVYKLDKTAGWSVTTREAATKIAVGGDLTKSYSSGTLTISGTFPTVPTNVSDFTNDAGYLTSSTGVTTFNGNSGAITFSETDPTVPSWAKENSKPSYTASEVGAVATSAVGAASGVAPLNSSSKIDEAYLPSYVDDVIEGYYYNNKFWKESSHTTEIPGESGKIYVDLSTDKTYRYGGTSFVEISSGTTVSVSRDLTTGTKIATITVNGSGSDIYAPTPASETQSETTGISIANHATGTIIGVSLATTSVTGVQSTTTTASKVTLGEDISIPNVTSAGSASTWTFEEKSIPNVTSAGSASTWTFEEKSIPNVTSAGSASTWAFEEKTIPNVTNAGSASTWTFEEKTIPNVTAAGSGSYTQGSFSGGSLTMSMDTTDTKKLNIVFTAATHGTDYHTHTPPTIGTAIKVQSKSGGANGSAPTLGTAIKVQSKSSGSNGSAPTLGTAIKVQSKSGGANGSAPTLGTAIKVQSKSGGANGSAPTLGTAISIPNITDVSDVTVPIKDTTATTVPIKNTSMSTFVTGTTHTITDNGHTHSI